MQILIGSKWRHADGGRYRVIAIFGQVKVDNSEWHPVIGYDHDDGTVGEGPYYTNRKRFLARFEKLED